jgi:hypothetical protein
VEKKEMAISKRDLESVFDQQYGHGNFEPNSAVRLIVSHGPLMWRAFCVGGVSGFFPAFWMIRMNRKRWDRDPPPFFLENAEMGCVVVDAREYPNQVNVNRLFESPTLFTHTSEEHLKALITLLRARLGRVIASKVEWETW